jgi:hypothetical protein
MILTPKSPASENVKFKLSTTSAYEFLFKIFLYNLDYALPYNPNKAFNT